VITVENLAGEIYEIRIGGVLVSTTTFDWAYTIYKLLYAVYGDIDNNESAPGN
jgi:hypothetical protein